MDAKPRILIIDDAALMRRMIADIVIEAGCEVVGEASNGQEAITMYEQLKPDIVTMDIVMPIMDGVQALRAIKNIDNKCKVVMVSAMGQQQQVIEAIQAGAKDFVVKPFDKERVVKAITKALEIE